MKGEMPAIHILEPVNSLWKMKSDYVICYRVGADRYVLNDLDGVIEAQGHKQAVERWLLALGKPYKLLRVVPVRGACEVSSRADMIVFRKATQDTYRAFFDLELKQAGYALTDGLRGKQYSRASAPCEIEIRAATA